MFFVVVQNIRVVLIYTTEILLEHNGKKESPNYWCCKINLTKLWLPAFGIIDLSLNNKKEQKILTFLKHRRYEKQNQHTITTYYQLWLLCTYVAMPSWAAWVGTAFHLPRPSPSLSSAPRGCCHCCLESGTCGPSQNQINIRKTVLLLLIMA